MQIGEGRELLRLEERERIPAHLPCAGDVRVCATLQLQDFSGTYADVWIERPGLERFVARLESLVRSREGAAKLEAMGPSELSVELRPSEEPGYFQAAVQLGRSQYSGGRSFPASLSGGFLFDPAQLPAILAGFQAFLREAS